MGTNCAPLLANLFLYSYENEFLDELIEEGRRKFPRKLSLSYCYTDDLISFNNKRLKEFIFNNYPTELSQLSCFLSSSAFHPRCVQQHNHQLYNKHGTIGFNIVNFPFMSSNIPSAPAYGVYASQLICYAHCCYGNFLSCHTALVTGLLWQHYRVDRLSSTFKKSMDNTLI